ncbi:uncharacterized protein BXZ73DRAFT_38529 [Epithele typhae]|uniref:uncharacterized protein n=1 Tax=Epithele typhae TaxID=378194 RepID=UPI002007B62B|nr:uncharacterized protein BXZ73DRAFT_38529 [Epithele typhae]KAH9945378.1 hypothetical protein BXZ73DRAFT_38529 [Epithele typhae]
MSCGNPSTEADALMQRRKKYDKTKACVRCKTSEGNLVVRHAVYCKDCFFPYVTHRFRRALEPTVNPIPDGPRKTTLKPAGNLLIGLSGGLGSSTLLDLAHRCYIALDKSTMPTNGGRDHPRHGQVWKKIVACYVEVCDAFPGMKDRTEDVSQFVGKYNEIDLISLRIQDAFDSSWWETVGGKTARSALGASLTDEGLPIEALSEATQDPLPSLRAYLSTLPTPTAVHASVQTLTRLLLLHTALHEGASHLVLGTSLTSLAVSLISGVAQGSGFNVREEMYEEWVPNPIVADQKEEKEKASLPVEHTIRVVRPLRDLGMKECAAWAHWSGVPVVGKEKWEWAGAKPGISALTKDFILGLEQDYPSTVSTIVRTCAKLAPKGAVACACALCGRPVQEGVQEWTARISIRAHPGPPSNPPSTSPAPPTPPADYAPNMSLTPLLCYPCRTMITSRSARPMPSPWPRAVGESRSGGAIALPVWTAARLSAAAAAAVDADTRGGGTDEEDGEVRQSKKMSLDEMRGVVDTFLLAD